MCGIVAYMGYNNVFDIIVEGLKILQNRGYDSAGICCKTDTNINLTKYASTNQETAISLLEKHQDEYNFDKNKLKIGIGHTRWATHGSKTTENSHPHSCEDIHVIHNGIIENYLELKTDKLSNTIFKSETDTEVIPCLISKIKGDTLSSFNETISQLRGTWAIIMIKEGDDNSIYIAKNGSPLMIGYDENNVFVTSECISYQKYTKHWMSLKDHECIRVFRYADKFYIEDKDGIILLSQYVPKDVLICEEQIILHTPEPFAYWTEKEIYEQSLTIWSTMNNGGRIMDNSRVKLGGMDGNEEVLLKVKHLVMIGCGTSYYSALFASRMFKEFDIFDTVQVFDASEIQESDLPINGSVGLVVVSQSGETKDCHRALQELKNIIVSIGIVNVAGSLLSRETDCGIHLNAGREVGVASTKVFTSQVVALFLLSVWFAQKKEKKFILRRNMISNLQQLPNLFERYRDYIREFVRSTLQHIRSSKKMFILGRSYDYSIALEGSLKIKELTYKNIEGYSGGSLKHGPFAMIDEDTVVFLHVSDNVYRDRMLNAVQEIKIRGASIVVITNTRIIFDQEIKVLRLDIDSEIFFSLVSVMVYQYIALDLAVLIGNNPDMPRNLAKVISVDG
jgi:glutamine---fructose-6-phosphate transaminase (isomerizing)